MTLFCNGFHSIREKKRITKWKYSKISLLLNCMYVFWTVYKDMQDVNSSYHWEMTCYIFVKNIFPCCLNISHLGESRTELWHQNFASFMTRHLLSPRGQNVGSVFLNQLAQNILCSWLPQAAEIQTSHGGEFVLIAREDANIPEGILGMVVLALQVTWHPCETKVMGQPRMLPRKLSSTKGKRGHKTHWWTSWSVPCPFWPHSSVLMPLPNMLPPKPSLSGWDNTRFAGIDILCMLDMVSKQITTWFKIINLPPMLIMKEI